MRLYHYLRKRGLALFMALVMCLSLLPAQAMAEANPVDLTGGSQEAKWEQLDATQIRGLLGAETSTFTAGELAQKLSSTLTIDGRTVTNLGIGPEGNVADVTALSSEAQNVTYALGENGSVSATSDEQDQEPTTYTVTYTDGVEGEEVFADQKTENLASGVATPAFNGTPTREGYTFKSWSPAVAETVTENVTYVAQWEEAAKKTFTVTWNPDNGEESKTVEVEVGQTPVYEGAALQKDGYIFKGWTPDVVSATGDATYTAVWEATTTGPTTYTVTYTDGVEDVEVFADQTNTVNAGVATPAFNGTLTRDGYTFTSWSPEVAETVTGDATYTAQWTPVTIDTQTFSAEALANSGPDDVGVVYLWAKFKAASSQGGNQTSSELSIVSATIGASDESGQPVDLLTADSFKVLFSNANTYTPATMLLKVTVNYPVEQSHPKLTFNLKPGLAYIENGWTTEDEHIEGTPRRDKSEYSSNYNSWGGYGFWGGKLEYTLKPGTQSFTAVVRLQLDKTLWEKQATTIANALEITASCDGMESVTKEFTATVPEYNNQELRVHSSGSGSRYITMSSAAPFSLRPGIRFNSIGGGGASYSMFHKKLEVKIFLPYVTVDGKKVYAQYNEDNTYISISQNVKPKVTYPEKGNEGYVVLTWENLHAGMTYITPAFQWPAEAKLTEGLNVTVPDPVVTSTFYNDVERTYGCNVYSSQKYTLSFGEKVIVEGIGTNTYYNWNNYKTNLGDMARHFGYLYVSNLNGVEESVPKKLTYTYKEAYWTDIGITAQEIWLGSKDATYTIRYKIAGDGSGEWIDYKGAAPNYNEWSGAAGFVFTREMAGLEDNQYFAAIEVDVSEGGYQAGYNPIDGNGRMNVYGKFLTPGQKTFTNFATLEVSDHEGTAHESVSKSISLSTVTDDRLGRYDASARFYDPPADPAGSPREISQLKSGNDFQIRGAIYTLNDNNAYLENPIIYLRLPKGLTLTKENVKLVPVERGIYPLNVNGKEIERGEWLVRGIDEQDPNNPNVPDADFVIREREDGDFTVYAVVCQNGAGAVSRKNQPYTYTELQYILEVHVAENVPQQELQLRDILFFTGKTDGVTQFQTYYNTDSTSDIWNVDQDESTKTMGAKIGILQIDQESSGLVFNIDKDSQHMYFKDAADVVPLKFHVANTTPQNISIQGNGQDNWSRFSYCIPIPQKGTWKQEYENMTHLQGEAAFSTQLKRAVLSNSELFQLEYTTKSDIACTNQNDSDWQVVTASADLSNATMLRVRVKPDASGIFHSGDSVDVEIKLGLRDDFQFGSTATFNCCGLGTTLASGGGPSSGHKPTGNIELEVANGILTGKVYEDLAHGDIHTAGEEKKFLPGVKVKAVNDADPSDEHTAVTDDDGLYTFTGLRNATYTVTVTDVVRGDGTASAGARRIVNGSSFTSNGADATIQVNMMDALQEEPKNELACNALVLERPHSVGYRIDGPNQAFANFGNSIFADTEWVWCNGTPVGVPHVNTTQQYRHIGWTAKVDEQPSDMTVTGPITDNVVFTAKIESNQLVVGAEVEVEGKDIHTTYDGQEHKIKLKVTDAATGKTIENPNIEYCSDEACTTPINNSFTDVCKEQTIWVKVSKDGYAPVTTSVKVEIKPAPLTVKVTDTSMTYGDTVPEVAYEVSGAQNGETAKVEGTLSWKDVGTKPNVGTYSSDGTLTMAEDGNFKLSNYELSLTQGTLTVGKRSVTLTSAGATKTYDGTPLTKRDGDVVTVTAGSWATGEGATYNVTGSQTIVGTGKNIFKYTLTSGAVAENYEIHTVYGDLVVTPRGSQETPKYQITVRANSLEATYNGSEFSCGGLERTLFKLSENGQEYRVEGLEAVTQTATNANGEGVVVAITLKTGYEKPIVRDSEGNDVTDSFVVDLEPGKLVIKPCEITLTAGSASKPYDGTPLTCNTFSVSKGEFVGTDGVDCEFSGSVTRVGQSVENKITKVTAKEGTSTNLSNYHITFLPGTLTVTALDDATRIPIKVTAESVEVPYNGEKQSVTTFTVDGATNNVITVNGEKFTVDTTGLTANGEGTNVGEYPVKVTGNLKVLDKDDENVSEQFKLVAVDGTLTIKKADLTLTSPDGEKVYDGTPLTATEGMKIEGLKDADKDKLHITITGTQTVPTTDAGVDNTFTYSFDDGTEKNYNVIPKYGKLKVTSRGEGENKKYEITLEPNSASYVYNGQERTFNGFDPDDFKFTLSNGVTYTVTNVTASASGKDFKEGGYPVVVKVGDTEVTDLSQPLTGVVVKDDQGNDVSSQFIVKVKPATLVIQKAPLTLISQTLSKPYDATELTNGDEPLQVENGWVNGEGELVKYEFTGSVQNPNQTAPNAFKVIWGDVNPDNYALDMREGQLSISSRTAKFEVTLTGASSADSEAYIYDGTEKSVSGFVGQETRTIKDQSVVCVPVKVTIDNREVTYYVTGLTSEATGINVSDSKETSINGTAVVYDADGNDVSSEFTVKAVSGKLIIKPRTVTLTSRDCTKVYDGTALTNDNDIVVGGDGWAKDEGASYKFTGSRTLVGDSTNEFSYTLQNNTDAGNYIISKVEGKLIVTAPDNEEVIEVKIEDVHKTYDGTTQTWELTEDLTFQWEGQKYTVVGPKVTASGKEYTDTGYLMTVTGKDTLVVKNSAGDVVTDVFQIVIEEGRLYIDKRAVTVKSGSGTWEYDGSTHTNHDVTVTKGSFVTGEEPAYTFDPTASQTLVGGNAENNKFTCNPPEGKEPDLYTKNYDITYSYGTLKVTGRTEKYPYSAHVSVEPVTYDGQPKEAEGSKTEEITRNGIKYWVTYTWDSSEHTDVQDGGYKLTTTCTVYDAPENGNDVTSQFAPKITADNLVINPASLTVKVTFEDRAYDGSTDVNVKDVSITGGKVGSDDVAVQFKTDAAKTGTVESGAASEEPKAVSYKDIKNALELTGVKSGNYVIDEVKLGTVTIGKAEPTVFLKDTEVTYNGKPAEVKADVTLVNGEKYEGEISYTYYSDPDGKEPLDGAPTDAGTYYVKASIAASDNYKAAESNIVSLVIKPAPLTIAVTFANRVYDGSTVVNTSGVSITDGMIDGDDVATRFKDDATKSGTVKDGTASEEPKTVSYENIKDALELTGVKSGNYVIDKVELGKVTISKATVTVTANNQSKTYDGYPFPTANFTYTLSGFVPGENWTSASVEGSVSYTGNAVNAINIGTYTITPVVSSLSAANYQFVPVNGILTINTQPNPVPPTPVPPTPVNPTPTPGGTTITDEETPLGGAVGLNDTDHYAYIAGYEDDTVRPTKNITRAEVATIFFRLMTEEFRVANWATENTLKDVLTSDWYNNAVSTCANAGIITGYADGRFQPQKAITRAEFAVIAARFLGPDADDEGVGDFSDTADHWAAAEIRKAAKAGWITGDGNKFRPNDPITRAEVMVIVNRMLDRTPDAEHMLPDMKTWIDNPEGTWYYEAVQEATNGHDYERDELNVETWTTIQTEKNWKAIEAEWAANNGASAPKDDAEPVEADGESK